MPTVDYLPIANNPGAFVVSQADYLILLAPAGRLVNGFPSGIVPKEEFNKPLRQATMVAAALANVIANVDGADVLDDGDLASLITRLQNALGVVAAAGAWTTGDVKLTLKTVADAGWILCDDGTVGDAASGATHASAANQALFTLLWTNVADAWAPVVTGRGGSAAADWAAHKKITLTKMLGRALAISGAGGGLTARALGQNLGEERHIQLAAELALHSHGVNDPTHAHNILGGNGSGGPQGAHDNASVGVEGGVVLAAATGITIQNAGNNDPMNVMQPTGFLNAMIKL